MRNIKPIFIWAKERGDANIYDRIIMKALPQLVKTDLKLTSKMIEEEKSIEVDENLYNVILNITQELIGEKYV